MVVLNALQSVLTIVLMIAIGYILSWKKWFDEGTSRLFSKLVVNISLPALMISNLMTTFTKEKLEQAGVGLVIPFTSMILCYALSIIISKLMKVDVKRRGTFQCMFFLSNTIFIGLPVNLALFGDHSVPYVLYYYIANTTMFWTIGVYNIRKDGGSTEGSLFSLETLKRIFSPPLMGFIVAIILILLNIKLPLFIMDTCKYIGNLTTPLSMLFIGIIIYSIDLREIKFDLEMLVVLVGRFVISPLSVLLFCHLLSAPTLMKDVFIIQAGLPIMTQTAIITQAYGADHKYGAMMVAVTTIASMFIIPIYMLLLS